MGLYCQNNPRIQRIYGMRVMGGGVRSTQERMRVAGVWGMRVTGSGFYLGYEDHRFMNLGYEGHRLRFHYNELRV